MKATFHTHLSNRSGRALHRWLVPVSLVALSVASTLLVQHVRAAGVPASGALTYSGFLALPDGTPVNAQKYIALAVYDHATTGTKQCEVTSGPVSVAAGRFQISLPDSCASAVKSTAELWVEIQVDGASVGRTKLGVVPYALEAGHASLADTATNAASAAAAASATGALDTQLSSFKTRLDALEPRATALESKKSLTKLESIMVNSSAPFQPECATTVNAQMCGVMAHRACIAAGYVTGWYVGESNDGRATMAAMCVK